MKYLRNGSFKMTMTTTVMMVVMITNIRGTMKEAESLGPGIEKTFLYDSESLTLHSSSNRS